MSIISATKRDFLCRSPFSINANEAETNCWESSSFPSLLKFSNVDILDSGNGQSHTDSKSTLNENKPYSPFNEYFGLAGIIKSFGSVSDKEQIHPSNTTENDSNSTWKSNLSQQYQSCRLEDNTIGYGEPLSNIWNNGDTDSSTHTSPLTPPNTFSSFAHFDNDFRINASVQHHVVCMLQAEEMLKLKRIEGKHQGHTGSIGDEDSLSEGSSNGGCSARGLMCNAVSAALANGIAGLNGADDGKFQRHRRVKLCVFCRNNGEPESVYKTHILKDAQGKVSCPVLRAYTCPTCGASGDQAHTLKYCPATQPTIIYSPGIPDNGMKW